MLTGADGADHTPAQPIAFITATWNTYDVPGVRPVTVTDVAAGFPITYVSPGAHEAPPSEDRRTAYCTIGEPPSLGAVHDTFIDVDAAFDATTPVT